MANKDFAFGLKPVRTLGGTSNFTANEYTIPSGASNAIFQGSLVIMTADGDIDIAASSSADIVGVFNGVF